MLESVVTVSWLAQRLGQPNVIVADCRFVLSDPAAGRRAYEHDHIPGAIFFDLETDLSRPKLGKAGGRAEAETATGGRHPLPSVAAMATLFGKAGINDDTTVVCYDEQHGGMAARLWWMLRYLGHTQAALLDGGYSAWRTAGQPVTGDVPTVTPTTFVPRVQHHMIADMTDVREGADTGRSIIVDSRAPERYRGETEPLDPVAGHIPGAVNIPWESNIDAKGRMLDTASLAKQFGSAGLMPSGSTVTPTADNSAPKDIIVHCGSGVTGCHNVLAMERAGVAGVRLYPGGWSEWCTHPDNPVAADK